MYPPKEPLIPGNNDSSDDAKYHELKSDDTSSVARHESYFSKAMANAAAMQDPDEAKEDTPNEQAKTSAKNSVLIKTISFGISGSVIAAHLVGNGKLLSTFGQEAAAAASVITTLQSLTVGTSLGIQLSTGNQLGAALAIPDKARRERAVAEAIKIGWLNAFLLSAISTAVFSSTPLWIPLIFNDAEKAKAIVDFFQFFAIAPLADIMTMTHGLIIFQVEENWWLPLISTIIYRLPAIGFGYLFAKQLEYGVQGLGIGSSIAAWLSFILTQLWFCRNAYQMFELSRLFDITDFRKKYAKFWSDGWKLGLQRITEWGNLFAIAVATNLIHSDALTAENPSIQAMVFFNLFSQGAGQAAMMLATRYVPEMKRQLEGFWNTNDYKAAKRYQALQQNNKSLFWTSNIVGLVANIGFAAALYFSKDNVVEYFIPESSSGEIHNLASIVLQLNALSLLPDSLRIISGGVLRGWGDLLIPTLASLGLMTFIGVPAGGVIGATISKGIVPLFILRVATIALSAGINFYRYSEHHANDSLAYEEACVGGELMKDLAKNDEKESSPHEMDVDLATNITKYGLSAEEAVNTSLFSVLATQINKLKSIQEPSEFKSVTAEQIQQSASKYIVENITTQNRAEKMKLLHALNSGDITQGRVIEAISRAMELDIVVITNNPEVTIIHQINKQKPDVPARMLVMLAHDIANGSYYALSGEPNTDLMQLMNNVNLQTKSDTHGVYKAGGLLQTLWENKPPLDTRINVSIETEAGRASIVTPSSRNIQFGS